MNKDEMRIDDREECDPMIDAAPRSSSETPEGCMTRPDGECVSEGPCIHGIPATLEGIEAGLMALVPPKDRSAKMPAMDAIMHAVEQLASPPPPSPTQETPRCPNCGSEKVAPTSGNGVGNTMDCLVCYTDFTPIDPSSPELRVKDFSDHLPDHPSNSQPASPPAELTEALDAMLSATRTMTQLMERSGSDDSYREQENRYHASRSELLALYTRQREEIAMEYSCAGQECGWYKTTVGLRDQVAALSSQLERLKADSLTAEEARHTLEELDNRFHPGKDFDSMYATHQIVLAKLRRLSSDSGTGGET